MVNITTIITISNRRKNENVQMILFGIFDTKNIDINIFFDYNNLIDYHYKLPSGFKDKEFNGLVLEAFK